MMAVRLTDLTPVTFGYPREVTKNQARLLVYGGLLSVALAGAAWWQRSFGRLPRDGSYNRDDNGLWMRRHWIHGGAAPVQPMTEALRSLGIRRIYPFLGPMDADGWPGWRSDGQIQRYDPASAAAFFSEMKRYAPEVKVIPWTGGVLHRDVRLEDTRQRAAFARHAADLVALGADGIQLNVEPMPSDSPGYLDLLKEVKAAIGEDKVLSVAAYPPTTALHPFPDVHWTLDFTRAVCMAADELAVMTYDTALQTPALYEGLMAQWTRELRDTLPPPEEGGCEWSVGLPAYEDDEPWHNPEAETIGAAIDGALRGLADAPVPESFRGVAVYASWTTDAEEWDIYQQAWRSRAPLGITVPEVPGP